MNLKNKIFFNGLWWTPFTYTVLTSKDKVIKNRKEKTKEPFLKNNYRRYILVG